MRSIDKYLHTTVAVLKETSQLSLLATDPEYDTQHWNDWNLFLNNR